MLPTLCHNQLIIAKKANSVHKYDIVVTKSNLIKRVYSISDTAAHLCGDNALESSEHVTAVDNIEYKLIYSRGII